MNLPRVEDVGRAARIPVKDRRQPAGRRGAASNREAEEERAARGGTGDLRVPVFGPGRPLG